MEAIFINISITTPSGKVVYELKKRLTNQQVLHDTLMELKQNVKIRVALKEQPTLDL